MRSSSRMKRVRSVRTVAMTVSSRGSARRPQPRSCRNAEP